MNTKPQINQYMNFWNKADIDGLMSMYAPEMIYHDMPSGEVIAFKDLRNHLSKTFAFNAGITLKLNEAVFPDESSAFIYWTQTLSTDDGRKAAQVNGVELIVFRDGKIVSIHEFYDYQGVEPEAVTETRDALSDQMTKLGLSDDMTATIASQIKQFFSQDEPFLDPDLSLTTVSEHLGHTRNQVSFVLNKVLNQTFYDLINQHRVQHVIQQMSSVETRRSILEMAINAGFNSMSGFYNAFKRQTGMSPVQFQKSKLDSEENQD